MLVARVKRTSGQYVCFRWGARKNLNSQCQLPVAARRGQERTGEEEACRPMQPEKREDKTIANCSQERPGEEEEKF